jgi:hypothetical protein
MKSPISAFLSGIIVNVAVLTIVIQMELPIVETYLIAMSAYLLGGLSFSMYKYYEDQE